MKNLVTIIALLLTASTHAIPTSSAEPGFGDWNRTCATGENGKELCQITQVTQQSDSDDLLFDITVAYLPDARSPVVFLTAPLGMYLPRGITIKLSDETLMTVAVQRCTEAGCLAVTTLDEAFLEEMQRATEGLFVFGRNAEQNVGVPLSLNGFAEALASIAPN
jgi:invasion protein IalB